MRRLIIQSAIASVALAGSTLAANVVKPAPTKARLATGPAKWAVDPATSRLGFRSAFSGTAFDGSFRRWSADIAFDPKNLAASKAVVTVDMTSAATGDASRDESLPTDDWFAAGKFKAATFTTTSIKDLGGGKYQAASNLTIRGVTKPVVLNFTVAVTGNEAKVSGTAVINRGQFGVGQGQWAGAETVPYNVTVNVNIAAKRVGPS